MMKLHKITTRQEFESLKKGDAIIVIWSDNNIKHIKSKKKKHMYNIIENRNDGVDSEIICQIKNNHYFNYDRQLQGLSGAEEVYSLLDALAVNSVNAKYSMEGSK